MSQSPVTAAILVIGNEILSGRTQDANVSWLAARLDALGIRVVEVRIVPDLTDRIVAALDALRSAVDYVFTSGGIGPTHDDITADAVARAFGVELVRDPEAVRRLSVHYGTEALNEARLKMAEVPAGASLIDNPVSSAPGFRIGNVFVMAGVPAILRAMFDGFSPALAGGTPLAKRTVGTMLGESKIAAGLSQIQEQWPQVEIGSYPFFRDGKAGTSLLLRATDLPHLEAATEAVIHMVQTLGDNPVLG